MNNFHPALRTILTLSALCVLVLCSCGGQGKSTLNITRLRCEYRVDPQGIDVTRPRLSWELIGEGRNLADGIPHSCRLRSAASRQ